MTKSTLDDPCPLPPERPASDDCCRSGCDRCVFDLYQEALERYREQLRAWEQRQVGAADGGRRAPIDSSARAAPCASAAKEGKAGRRR